MLFAFLQIILKMANPKITKPKIANGTTTNNFSFSPIQKVEKAYNLV